MGDNDLCRLFREKKEVSEPAFAEFYARHSKRIYAYCRTVFGNDDQAKDIFQETFLKFYESIQGGKEMTNAPAYLLIIARNLCLNAKTRSREIVGIEDYMAVHNDRSHEQAELVELITAAMELLPDDSREAFFLREFEDMPYSEIASIVGAPEGTVRVRVTRARDRIRTILKPYIVEYSQS